MYARIVAACLLSLLFSSCAIHPLPEDVTGVNTPTIVQRIRCETRQAASEAFVNWLAPLGRDHPGQPGIPLVRDLVMEYDHDPDSISSFRARLLKALKGHYYEQIRNVINLFYAIGVAYNFDLTMTEQNDLSAGSANLQRQFSRSLFKLGFGGGLTLKRSNQRTFTVTDTFDYLLNSMNGRRDCGGNVVEANHVYPITGRIGVDKIVYDFLDLAVFGNLAGDKSKPTGPPTMADNLTFTTTLDASATPHINFTPVGDAFQLTDAGITADAKRTDVHQVAVGLAIPTKANVYLTGLRSYLYPSAGGVAHVTARPAHAAGPTIIIGSRVIGGGTEAEQMAVYAIDQLKSPQIQLIPSP